MARPSEADLAVWLGCGMKADAIANMCGASPSTASAWIQEHKLRTGQAKSKTRAKARTLKSRAQLQELAAEMLDVAISVARDKDMFTSPRDMIAQAKLALEVRAAILDSVANAPKDTARADRPELLARVKERTAGAEAKAKLRLLQGSG